MKISLCPKIKIKSENSYGLSCKIVVRNVVKVVGGKLPNNFIFQTYLLVSIISKLFKKLASQVC